MGWWTDRAGRLLGDGPADVIEAGLARLGEATRPTLADLLAGIGRLLRDQPGRYAAAAGARWHLVATHGDGETVEGVTPTGAVAEALAEMLDDVAEQYQLSELARPPTVDEVAATLGFVLGHEPSRLVSGAGVHPVIRREPA